MMPHLWFDGDPEFVPKRTIVVAVDSSPSTLHTIDWILDHLTFAQDLVLLVHVRPAYKEFGSIEMSSHYTPITYPLTHPSMEDDEKRDSYHLLIQLAQRCARNKIHCKTIALQGETQKELLQCIKDTKPHLVVMGKRGMGPVKKWILGSVSEYIVQHSPVPTLIIPNSS
jgi:nucleotide-binding universal stress UspA family protein